MSKLLYVDASTLTNLANAFGALSGSAGKIIAGDAAQQATIGAAAQELNRLSQCLGSIRFSRTVPIYRNSI